MSEKQETHHDMRYPNNATLLYFATGFGFNAPDEGVPWDDIRRSKGCLGRLNELGSRFQRWVTELRNDRLVILEVETILVRVVGDGG